VNIVFTASKESATEQIDETAKKATLGVLPKKSWQ